ncbi:conserved hypothetical protein [Rubrivivax sp. A210]|uniref:DUF5672 family protein n=1 Tax=Rubrivivax sp. A210 TaxID=2772301 RepID=UPI00191A5364|nr:DUF5672 family protein [Rubrivivax sp. A210]CAD5373975.1 conserved hypothetical protein [Rubrivivax sp. A210]
MTRLPLAQVTLCAVETRTPALALQALLRSMHQVDFGRVLLFTNGWTPRRVVPGVELYDIDAIETEAAYSNFLLRKLPYYVRSSHALVTRWDGFVVNAAAFSPEFLVYDYLAPVWPGEPEGRNVGSGGFSLRSRRYLRAGLDPRIVDEHPEDIVMGRQQRAFLEREHGISFAPAKLARLFAAGGEDGGQGASFGFHGVHHLPRVVDEAELSRWLVELPDAFFRGNDAVCLARAMQNQGMAAAAARVRERRLAAGGSSEGAAGCCQPSLAGRVLAALGLRR